MLGKINASSNALLLALQRFFWKKKKSEDVLRIYGELYIQTWGLREGK